MTKYAATEVRDLYAEVTNKIISRMEQGVAPWRMPWSRYGAARNYATGHVYTGINYILMNTAPYEIPYYMTFMQAKELGGNVRKGAKSELVINFNISYKHDGKTVSYEDAQRLTLSGQEIEVRKGIKHYCVFNVADIEGIEIKTPEIKTYDNDPIAECEKVVAGMPNRPDIRTENANQAYYSPIADFVNMPNLKQFETAQHYYATLFHELSHATGHQTRLNRATVTDSDGFGGKKYSVEELTAELSACFLCNSCGIDYDLDNSAAYLQGWLKVLKADNKMLFKAAAAAQKAADYILG